jgi:hypothetical protein
MAVCACLAGCTSTAVISEVGGANIPAFYTAHRTGIVDSPTDADVILAERFGRYARDHSDVVQSAYISRIELTKASVEPFHIVVRTPLYLVSRHVMEQHAEKQSVDPNFVDFARRLGLVQLAISKTMITSETWRSYVIDREMVLLRDGQIVLPVTSVPAWKGCDPFEDLNDPLETWRSTSWLRRGVEEMQEHQLRATQEAAADRKDHLRVSRLSSGWIALQPGAAVFPVAELRKPGRYEIAFRQPSGAPQNRSAPAEIRLPIAFDNFR